MPKVQRVAPHGEEAVGAMSEATYIVGERCRVCGEPMSDRYVSEQAHQFHEPGCSGIVCDWLHGKPTPGLSPERQEAIARDVLAYIAACEAS